MVLLVLSTLLALLAVGAIVGTFATVMRDGYRAIPTDPVRAALAPQPSASATAPSPSATSR